MQRICYSFDITMVSNINHGTMMDGNVTDRVVELATDIYGADISRLNNKIRDKKNKKYRKLAVEIVVEKPQVFYADVFYWRGVDFCVICSKTSMASHNTVAAEITINTMTDAIEAMHGYQDNFPRFYCKRD
jgi:hypothetical protein